MTMSDPLGDMLTRIRNGQRTGKSTVKSPASNLRRNVLDVLQKEGYIRGYTEEELKPGIKELTIELRYYEGGPVIKEISRVSRPGLRVYSKIDDLTKVYGGLGISVVAASLGEMSDNDARDAKVGGEVLCRVF